VPKLLLSIASLGVAGLLGAVACSSTKDTCSCVVELGNERRTLACGDNACISGMTVSCVDDERTLERGSCSAAPAASGAPTESPTSPAAPDDSCANLQVFCDASCLGPATVAADCTATASAGDAPSCAAWQLVNGALCQP